MKKQLLVVGYDTGVQHQDIPAPKIGPYLTMDAIDLGTFEALTDTAEGNHGDFTITADSVYATPIDAHTLSLIDRGDRRLMREFLKLRLALPCKPIELVEFVKATNGAFTLPYRYAARVRSRPVAPDAAPATKAGRTEIEAVETTKQRQDRRLKQFEDAGLTMPESYLGRLPYGVGLAAKREGVSRQSFSADLKAALKRRESLKREGVTVHKS